VTSNSRNKGCWVRPPARPFMSSAPRPHRRLPGRAQAQARRAATGAVTTSPAWRRPTTSSCWRRDRAVLPRLRWRR